MPFKINKQEGITEDECAAVMEHYNANKPVAAAMLHTLPNRGGFCIPFEHLPPHLMKVPPDQRRKELRWKHVDLPFRDRPEDTHLSSPPSTITIALPTLVSYFNHFPFMPDEERLLYASLCHVFDRANVKHYHAISAAVKSSPDGLASFML